MPIRSDGAADRASCRSTSRCPACAPDLSEIEIAIAVADAAAAAVLGAQRALEARSNREALQLLFELSASLTNDDDVDTVLHTCCDGIRRALGFERVVIEIADDDSDQLRLRASLGWEDGPPEGVNSLDDVARLCDPAYEVEGCYLWPAEEAMAAGRPAGAPLRVAQQRRRARWRGTTTG